MITKELFFHEQTPGGRSLGFSAIFVPCKGPNKDQQGNTLVWMAITFCNKKDSFFNKKIARKVLRDRPLELVKAKDIPAKLADASNKSRPVTMAMACDYYNMYRHFV